MIFVANVTRSISKMVNTFLTYNKIHRGITGVNAKHAGSTQPPLFSNLVELETERPEWEWLKHDEDFDFE